METFKKYNQKKTKKEKKKRISLFQKKAKKVKQKVKMSEHKELPKGLTDREGAKAVARRIWDAYDRDRDGRIDNVEVVPMIVDAYRPINRSYNPSRADIDAYIKVLDSTGNGRIEYDDIETLCFKYLLAEGTTGQKITSSITESVSYSKKI